MSGLEFRKYILSKRRVHSHAICLWFEKSSVDIAMNVCESRLLCRRTQHMGIGRPVMVFSLVSNNRTSDCSKLRLVKSSRGAIPSSYSGGGRCPRPFSGIIFREGAMVVLQQRAVGHCMVRASLLVSVFISKTQIRFP